MPPTFADPDLQERFERDGFVVVPLLDQDEVDALAAGYEATHTGSGAGFEPDFASDDRPRKQAADRAIREHLVPHVERTFADHRIFFTSYLMKWADDASALPLHQDWSYVDEDEHVTVAMWCALADADDDLDNGPLVVLPGSHRLAPRLRGTRTPGWHEAYGDALDATLVSVPVRRGDVVLLDNRVLHGSPPNRSGTPRLAAAAAVAPRAAELRHVYVDDDEVVVYDVDEAFFLDTSPIELIMTGPPAGLAERERRPYEPPAVGPADLAEVCGIEVALPADTDHGADGADEADKADEGSSPDPGEAEAPPVEAAPGPPPTLLRRARRLAGRAKRKARRELRRLVPARS